MYWKGNFFVPWKTGYNTIYTREKDYTMRQSLILFLTAVIWGVAFVAQSAGMEHLGPFTYNGVRSVLGGLVLIPCIVLLNRIQGRNGSEERDTDGRLQQNPAVDGTVHSKLSSCSTCRLAGRMAIHAVKVEDFHSNIKAHAGSFPGVCFLTIYKNFFLI